MRVLYHEIQDWCDAPRCLVAGIVFKMRLFRFDRRVFASYHYEVYRNKTEHDWTHHREVVRERFNKKSRKWYHETKKRKEAASRARETSATRLVVFV